MTGANALAEDLVRNLPQDMLEILLRNDFATFVRKTFETLNPGAKLHWSPYLDYLCAKLQDLAEGRIKRLIVMVPPRHLKSCCANVALTAFFLGHFPGKDVMSVSYSGELAKGFGEDVRKVMMSDCYQAAFDTRLASIRAPASALKTTAGGVRRATSIDGTATGVGADLLIFDDPQKPGEILSDTVRRNTNQAYENTFLSRRNDPNTCGVLVIMQRLHEDDFIGHVQSLETGWEVVRLPALAEEDELVRYRSALGERIYRRLKGEPLNAGRISLEELKRIRSASGEAVWASQYMQSPTPAGGGLIQPAWFLRYSDRPAAFQRIIQSWDTASSVEEWSNYSVCTTWGVNGETIYLLDVFRARLIYPDLKREITRLAKLWGATEVIIEDAASGKQVLQDLGAAGFHIARGVKPDRDKQTRMANQTALIETGRVYIPEQAPWLAEFLHELVMFPNGKYDDQVDSTSQALAQLNYKEMKGRNVYDYYRLECERLNGRCEEPAEILRMQAEVGNNVLYDMEGKEHRMQPDGYFHLEKKLALFMSGKMGWTLIDQPVEGG